jgi:hypothetical protein
VSGGQDDRPSKNDASAHGLHDGDRIRDKLNDAVQENASPWSAVQLRHNESYGVWSERGEAKPAARAPFEIYARQAKLQSDGLGGSYGVERPSHYAMRLEMCPPDTTIYK